MKITYIDKPSYLPAWGRKQLEGLGTFRVFDDKPDSATATARLRSTDIAIVEWTDITEKMLSNPGTLKCIVLVTTGYSFVDIKAARSKNVLVCNTPQYSRQSVAEHAIGMMLSLAKRLPAADQLVRAGSSDYTSHTVGKELFGTTLGIIGMGNIGTWIARLGLGFGMKVIGFSRSKFSIPDVDQVPLDALCAKSDFIVSSVSVNNQSKGLLSRKLLGSTKPDCVLVNIAGNAVLDESALVDLLARGHFFGVGFEDIEDKRLLKAPRTLFSPGTAWYTQASLDRNVTMFVETVKAFRDGHPRFVVN